MSIQSTLEYASNDINLSFSKRFPVADSLVNRDILDYTNVIFNIMKLADKDELFVSVDYQKHFDPFLNSTLELKYDDFVKSANHFNSNNYLSWLNVNYLG